MTGGLCLSERLEVKGSYFVILVDLLAACDKVFFECSAGSKLRIREYAARYGMITHDLVFAEDIFNSHKALFACNVSKLCARDDISDSVDVRNARSHVVVNLYKALVRKLNACLLQSCTFRKRSAAYRNQEILGCKLFSA